MDFGASSLGAENDRAIYRPNRQASSRNRLLHSYAFRSGHGGVNQLPVDEPQLDTSIAPGATKRGSLRKGCVRERQSAVGNARWVHMLRATLLALMPFAVTNFAVDLMIGVRCFR